MSDKPVLPSFPRRDKHGRAVSLAELTFAGVGSAIIGLLGVAIVDGILALFGLSRLGSASGWLALILPALFYFDDLRGWRGYPVRFVVAFLAAVVAIGAGLLITGQLSGLPALLSGGVGAVIAAVIYSPAWFFGVRWSTGQHSEMGSR